MLRRALLLAALAAPLAAAGQSIATTPAQPFSKAACDGTTTTTLVLNWSMATGTTMPSGGRYRIVTSASNDCLNSGTPLVVADSIVPVTSATDTAGISGQRYPPVGDTTSVFSVKTLAVKASVDCTKNPVIYLCAQLMNSATWVASTNILALSVESVPPAVPVGVTAAPGQNSLTVSWTDGVSSGVAASTYTAKAYKVLPACTGQVPGSVPRSCLDLGTVAAEGSTSAKSIRLTGLTIGQAYGAEVVAVSATGLTSDPSASATGIPIQVYDYWDKYTAMNGPEQGGCAGGPAGVLSLLAVAGLVRSLRRRP
jgi:hypothetical protein